MIDAPSTGALQSHNAEFEVPAGWTVTQISDIGQPGVPTIKAGPFGSSLTKDSYVPSGYKIYGQEQVIREDAGYGDYYIDGKKYHQLQSCAVVPGDVLMSLVGTAGKVLVVPQSATPGIINPRLIRIRVNANRVSPTFLAYYLRSSLTQDKLAAIAQGGTMGVLNATTVSSLLIALPPLPEQKAIASSLVDADNLIRSLERLIAKKHAIKQGMVQQLLTGRTRIPGFSKPWIETTAGAVGTFKGGSGFPIRFQGARSGNYPFFKVSDMNNPGNDVFMKTARNYISETQRKQIGAVRMPEGAIVFAKVGAAVFLERKRILVQQSCIDNNMAAMAVDPTIADVRFVHYLLCNFPISSLVATTALPSLNSGQLRSIRFTLPSDLTEQRAIASVLADADDELGVLQERLTKDKAVKQGMMQELLTGRTRLAVAEALA